MKKTVKQIAISCLYILLPISVIMAQAPEVLWTQTIGESSSDVAFAVFPTVDDGFMIGGYTINSGQRDFYMVKTDGAGNVTWDKNFGQADRFESASCMIETSDGGYLLAGGRAGDFPNASNTDIYLVKTDSEGNELWSSIIGYDSVSETPSSVCQTSDGGYIVCGSYWATPLTSYDVLIVKTNALGLQEWRQVLSFEEGMAEHASCIIEDTDGGYLVTGETQAFQGDYSKNAFILKTDITGEMEWIQTYGGSWPWYEGAYHIIHTSDGGYFLSGYQNNDGIDNNWFVVKTNGDGVELWSDNSIGGAYHDKAFYACETSDSGVAVTGNYHNGTWKAFITKYNTDGDTLWTKLWGYEGLNQYNYAIQQLPDGGYITAGSTTTDAEEIKIFLTRLSPDFVGINESELPKKNTGVELMACQPNPFSTNTIIPIKLKSARHVSVTIHNILGQKIKTLTDEFLPAGNHNIIFNASDFPEGLYFCRISSGAYSRVIKLKKVY